MADARVVRAARLADSEAVRSIYAPMVEGTATSFEETPPDAGEIRRRMLVRPRLPWLVADTAESVRGYAYASPHRSRPAYRWSADCSVYVDPSYRSQGLGRALYEHLIAELRNLGYVSLFAGIALPNDASVGLHASLGFQAVGAFRHVGYKHGRWHDVGWWQLLLTDPPSSPPEPQEWAATG